MKTKLEHTDWGEIFGTSIINHQWLGFKENIKKIEDEFINEINPYLCQLTNKRDHGLVF